VAIVTESEEEGDSMPRVHYVQPEDADREEEAARQHTIDLLEEPDLAGETARPHEQKPRQNLELHSLAEVHLDDLVLGAHGKKELKVVWHHSKVKVQTDLNDLGLHRIHLTFASIRAIDWEEMDDHVAIVFLLCACAMIEAFDTNKTKRTAAGIMKNEWVSAFKKKADDEEGLPRTTQVRFRCAGPGLASITIRLPRC
tara:strand:+ start:75 stop:668 length:594 start_codon:yes stop_codon:yes gene_type:complete